MICTKCSGQIPDGAKFCPNCGASFMQAHDVMPSTASAPEPEKKYYCEKCGLELSRGAKFCAVCGGAAKARDISPIENGGETFGGGAMSAVSIDKPMESDGLVSAMNAAPVNTAPAAPTAPASPASFGVPTPSYGEPTVPVSSSVPTPSNSGFNSGYTAPAPTFAPSSDAADMGGFGDPNMGNMPMFSGTNVAVKPIKKKSPGKTIAIVAGIVVAALLAAAAILFFTNRAFVLSTLMGKSKYAAMVEGNNIKSMTDKIDMNSVANGIKSSSSAVMALRGMSDGSSIDLMDMTDSIYGSAASSRMSGSGSMNYMPAIDLSAMEKMYADLLRETYGKNDVKGSLEMQVNLGSALKAIISDEMSGDDMEEFNKVLDYINGTKFTYDVAANDSALGCSFGTDGKIKINTKVLMNGQDMYISLPFASDKAIKITLDKPAEISTEFKALEFDAKELERIIGDIVNIYLEKYASLEIEMDNGKVTAAGITVEGKLISAKFTDKDLLDVAKKICEYIANDEYLSGKIIEFTNECGGELTKDKYYNGVMDMYKDIPADALKDCTLTLNTAIDRNGNILGKSLVINTGSQKFTVSYAETKDKSGCDIDLGGVLIYALDEKTDDHNGSCSLGVNAMGTAVSLVMDYSDVNTVKFGNTEVMTGKYELSMKMPQAFEQQLGKEAFAACTGSKITMEIAVNGDTMNESVSVTVPGYLDASVKETVTAVDDNSALSVPSNVVDITPLAKGEYLDDAAANDFAQFAKDIANKLNEMGFAEIDQDDIDSIDPTVLTGKAPKERIDWLIEYLGEIKENISEGKANADEEKAAKLDELDKQCDALLNKVKGKDLSYDEYYEIFDEVSDLNSDVKDVVSGWNDDDRNDDNWNDDYKFSTKDIDDMYESFGDIYDFIDEAIASADPNGVTVLNNIRTQYQDLENRSRAAGYQMSESQFNGFLEEYTQLMIALIPYVQY